MINRELIRLKVVQLTYAYYQNGNRNIDAAEKELVFSLSKAYDMYNHLLQLIVAVTDEARKHYDVEAARAEREGTTPPSPKIRQQPSRPQARGKRDAGGIRGEN